MGEYGVLKWPGKRRPKTIKVLVTDANGRTTTKRWRLTVETVKSQRPSNTGEPR